jgi:hypothetical protein
MLEYITTIKSIIDVLKGTNDLRTTVGADKRFFDETITPVFQGMSTVVQNYLLIHEKLRASIRGLSENERNECINQFAKDRIELLPLRRQMTAHCSAVLRSNKYKRFSQIL